MINHGFLTMTSHWFICHHVCHQVQPDETPELLSLAGIPGSGERATLVMTLPAYQGNPAKQEAN